MGEWWLRCRICWEVGAAARGRAVGFRARSWAVKSLRSSANAHLHARKKAPIRGRRLRPPVHLTPQPMGGRCPPSRASSCCSGQRPLCLEVGSIRQACQCGKEGLYAAHCAAGGAPANTAAMLHASCGALAAATKHANSSLLDVGMPTQTLGREAGRPAACSTPDTACIIMARHLRPCTVSQYGRRLQRASCWYSVNHILHACNSAPASTRQRRCAGNSPTVLRCAGHSPTVLRCA